MKPIEEAKRHLSHQALRLIIGYPSSDNFKATGLQYQAEYYDKESKNQSRSGWHRLNAQIANMVLTSKELETFIQGEVEKYADQLMDKGYETSGIKDEDKEAEKLAEKIVKPTAKRTTKTSAK